MGASEGGGRRSAPAADLGDGGGEDAPQPGAGLRHTLARRRRVVLPELVELRVLVPSGRRNGRA
jgi:hypothetical protein